MSVLKLIDDLGGIPESRFSENSENVKPEIRESLGFQFQEER